MSRSVRLFICVLGLVACKTRSEPEPRPETVKSPPPVAITPDQAGVAATGSGSATAPATTPATPDDPWLTAKVEDPLPHPLFWSIEKDGKTTYVLGTMHLGVDPDKRLPPIVRQKFGPAPVLAVEANLEEGSLTDMIRKDGGTLHQDLGPAYWKKLETAIGPTMANGIDKMKPMVATTFLSMKGLEGTPPMDGVLVTHAQLEKKELIYLEPAGKQLALLEKWMNIKALKMMLDHLKDTEDNTKQLLNAYLEGDESKLVKLGDADKDMAKKSGFTEAELEAETNDLLYARNASWIDKIEDVHKKGNAFIAVGAMHLLGPKSVLELLQAKGYKITRLDPGATK